MLFRTSAKQIVEFPCSHTDDIFIAVWLIYIVPFLQGALDLLKLVLKLVIISYTHSVHPRSFKPYNDIYLDIEHLSYLNYKLKWLLSLCRETGQLTSLPFNISCLSFMLPHVRLAAQTCHQQ